MKTKTFLNCLLALLLSMPMNAQQKLFTLEDLNFGGRNYHNLRPQNMFLTWWGDQLVQTDVEECSLVNPKTGKKTKLFTLDQINEWAKSDGDQRQVRHLMSATFPYPDQPIVAVGNRHAFLLIDFKQKQIVWQDSLSGQQANDWSPQSKATAYVENSQLFVVDAQGKKHQLTTDGSREIVYGQSVHRDEFGITKGTFWSPDGQHLAFYRMDQSMVTDYPQVGIPSLPREGWSKTEGISAPIAEMEPDKYPMTGTNTHVVTIGVYDLQTQKTIYLKTPAVEYAAMPSQPQSPCYFTNIAFSPDSRHIFVQELNRDQNDCRLVSYDAETGKREYELCRETSDKYVEPLHPIQFLPWSPNTFILQSQRDGYNHLYLYSIKGECIKQLTKGPWVVLDVLGFNQKTKSIIIASNEKHPLQRNLYAVDAWTGQLTPLDNGEGVHRGVLSEGTGSLLYDKWQTPTTPNNIDLVNAKDGKGKRLLTAEDPWKDYLQPIYENGSIKAADGTTDLYWRMVKPRDFNPAKQYPTVVYVYGGPHAHNVDASWHWLSRSWETYMAQKGYIVFILDNRGSENRGRDFEQAPFRQLGQVEMQDQMKGVEFLRTLPYVDSNRLGVHGWSYGGYMTISLMTNYPDVFKVGVAGGPVIDWHWYEVMYGERYMDTPQQNPEGYAKTSLIAKAKNLKGKLQIIIGYNDPTVVPQHALSFIRACVEAGTQPDFFAYPGEGHNMMGHASVHLHERITQYFEDYLK
ncbi:MAG: DPP IV N-terminal domain-containing protein [Prevotella sp.]|nr:DPP IV N-terminal domain-containing protein [Prevotella sp.]